MGDAESVLAGTTPDSSMMPPGATGPNVPLQQLQPQTQPTGMPQQPPQDTTQPQQPQYQTTPASQDPEVVAGAAHQSWLARIMDSVSNILGGDTTLHVTKHPDGTVEVTHDPSTTGEKWGRIAQAALGGAAKGMEVGQGPGGPARAAAGGIQTGMAQPQERLDAANKEGATQQKQLQDQANFVLTQQKLIGQTLANKAAGMTLSKEEQDQSNDEHDRYINSPNSTFVGTFGSIHEAATSPNAAMILKNHPNATLRTATAYDSKGNITGVHAYVVDRDWGDRRNEDPVYYLEQKAATDPNAPPEFEQKMIPANSDTNSRLDTFTTAKNLAVAKIKADWATQQQKLHPTPKTLAEMQLRLQQTTDPAEKAQLQSTITAMQNTPEAIAAVKEKQAATAAAQSETDIRRENLAILQGGAGGGKAAEGLKGEDYLQASGIDPASWNRIRSTANGDLKPPTQSRSPANAAFLNAVQNYDPSYTQARYDTKQNFKTKGDATSIMQLSTAMAHADRALRNSAVLGDSPSLATGINLSGPAAAYNADANFFTGEQGKLVMGGIVGEKEAERIRNNISSPVQSIRDAGLREVLQLTGGKTRQIFQKYKTGAGQDLPVQEFFDQPTQQLLQRYGVAPKQPGAAGPGAGGAGGLITVTATAPGGKPTPYSFKTQAQADDFKAKAKAQGANVQ